jgi:DNA-binding NtrC family response regulator
MPDQHLEKILVVDDEAIVGQSIKRTLESDGYRVDVETSGEAVLRREAAELAAYGLILIDMMMPGVGGLDLFKGIQAKTAGARVVIITGYPTVKAEAQARKMGAFDFLSKPFTPAELRASVARALAKAADAPGGAKG